jgi:hypothetical protein
LAVLKTFGSTSHILPCGACRLKSGISQLIKEVGRNLSKITASPVLSG